MSRQNQGSPHFHGPENAEHEIRKAYNSVIEAEVAYSWDKKAISGVNFQELTHIYKHAFNHHRQGNRLAAERWARTAKHLSRAFRSEAKIAFLEPRSTELPFLEGATDEEYELRERPDTTADLLDSVAGHIPPGLDAMPEDMKKYLSRGRRHLELAKAPEYKHELLQAELIKAAHEYGRVLECMALAFEAEKSHKSAAA